MNFVRKSREWCLLFQPTRRNLLDLVTSHMACKPDDLRLVTSPDNTNVTSVFVIVVVFNMAGKHDFDLFVAGKTGSFKGTNNLRYLHFRCIEWYHNKYV